MKKIIMTIFPDTKLEEKVVFEVRDGAKAEEIEDQFAELLANATGAYLEEAPEE